MSRSGKKEANTDMWQRRELGGALAQIFDAILRDAQIIFLPRIIEWGPRIMGVPVLFEAGGE